jgi:hypothetical protein
MCDQCSKIFKTDKKHDPSVCPIALSLTCSCCKIKGHSTLKCTNYHLWNTRVPEFLEQLIPLSLRIHHAIPFDQKTPIPKPNNKPLPCPHILLDLAKERMDNARDQNKGLPVTLKPDPGLQCSQCRPTLEIPEDKEGSHVANIRATLASNNLPSSSAKENKKLIETYSAVNGKKVIYLGKNKPILQMKFVDPVQKDVRPNQSVSPNQSATSIQANAQDTEITAKKKKAFKLKAST